MSAACSPGICYNDTSYPTLEAALTASANDPGAVITLGVGTFVETPSQNLLRVKSQTIIGQGMGQTIIEFPVLQTSHGNNDGVAAVFRDLSLRPQAANDRAVSLEDTDGELLERVEVSGAYGAGLYCGGGSGGIVIRNCNIHDNGGYGLTALDKAHVEVYDSTITGNVSNGLNIGKNSCLTATNNTVQNNGGRGIMVDQSNSAVPNALALIQLIRDNDVSGTGTGGIHVSQATVDDVTIDGNTVTSAGPGIKVAAVGGAIGISMTVTDNSVTGVVPGADLGISVSGAGDHLITGNTVGGINAGGTWLVDRSIADIGAETTQIRENIVTGDLAAGEQCSGVFIDSTAMTSGTVEANDISGQTVGIVVKRTGSAASTARLLIVDNVLHDNLAEPSRSVSGIYLAYDVRDCLVDVVNNTMYNNGGTDLYVYNGPAGGVFNVVNNIFHGGGRTYGVRLNNGFTVFFDRNIFNSPAGSYLSNAPNGVVVSGSNDLNQDPLLDAAYVPQTNSPAIDTGNASYAAAAGSSDFDGSPRIDGAGIDVGAQEAVTGCTCESLANDVFDAVCTALGLSPPENVAGFEADFATVAAAQIAAAGCLPSGTEQACLAQLRNQLNQQ